MHLYLLLRSLELIDKFQLLTKDCIAIYKKRNSRELFDGEIIWFDVIYQPKSQECYPFLQTRGSVPFTLLILICMLYFM